MWLCTYILMTSLVTLLIQTNLSKANVPFQQGEIVTCSGKCGVESNFPCSCHAKCFVRKNCCENITLDCPNILAESRSKYRSLLDADVVCYAAENTGVFMISSCPNDRVRRSVTASVPNRRKSRSDLELEIDLGLFKFMKLMEAETATEIRPLGKFAAQEFVKGLRISSSMNRNEKTNEDYIQVKSPPSTKNVEKLEIFTRTSNPRINQRLDTNYLSMIQAHGTENEHPMNSNIQPDLRVRDRVNHSRLEMNPIEETDQERKIRSARSAISNATIQKNIVIQALKNAPVWDSSTRFSYLNSDVFFCHGGKTSNLVKWQVQFGMTDKADISDLHEIAARIKSSKMKYKPPFSIATETSELCVTSASGSESCDQNILQDNPTLEQLCNGFVSYVSTGKDSDFRNRFCCYCTNGINDMFQPLSYPKFSTSLKIIGLSVIFSLDENNLLKLEFKKKITKTLWADPVCNSLWSFNVDQTFNSENNLTCATISCDHYFEVRPDGDCKTLHNTFIGFSDDDFPLTQQEEIKFSQFLGCGIDKYLGIEVIDFNSSVIKQHNEILNRTFYVTNASTFLTSFSSLSPSDPSLGTTLTKMRLLLQAFIEYRKPPSESVCKFAWVRTKPLNKFKMMKRTNSSVSSSLRYLQHSFQFLNTFSLPVSRNESEREVYSEDIISCLGSSPVIYRHVGKLYCLQEPIYESDLPLILDICQSTCFDFFKQTSGHTSILVTQIELVFFHVIGVMIINTW